MLRKGAKRRSNSVQSQVSKSKKQNQKELKGVKMLKKSLSIVLVALFVFSFISVAALSAAEVKGKLVSANAETGEVVVQDDAGETKTLMADPKAEGAVDIKMLKEGDSVNVESDSDGVIKSIQAE